MGKQEKSPIFEQVVQMAVEKFWGKKKYNYRGHQEPYGEFHAADAAVRSTVRKLRTNPIDLAISLIHQTSMTPDQVGLLDMLGSRKSWKEYFIDLAVYIVAAEMTVRDSQISAESRRRDKLYQ